jgi:hypothetical protein
MNPFLVRIAITAASTLIALIAAQALGFAPSLEMLLGAFFVGGFAGAFIASRVNTDLGTPVS